jgi:hypothetical protein
MIGRREEAVVDPRTRKLVGWAVAAVGAIIAVVAALADSLGIGGEGPDEFGPKQVAALVAGLVVVAAGLALALLSARSSRT